MHAHTEWAELLTLDPCNTTFSDLLCIIENIGLGLQLIFVQNHIIICCCFEVYAYENLTVRSFLHCLIQYSLGLSVSRVFIVFYKNKESKA
jgi:hypothetical protein